MFSLTACDSEASKARALTPQELRGRDVFQANCSQCHNAYKKEPLQGPALVGVFRKRELPSGIPATDQHVRDTIIMGRRNMPPFNGVLDDQQMRDLMAFLHTL
jgi:mono/diheme cytochrome c family protein